MSSKSIAKPTTLATMREYVRKEERQVLVAAALDKLNDTATTVSRYWTYERVELTSKLLMACDKVGIKRLTINFAHPSVPNSKWWKQYASSVCTPEKTYGGRPAIWKARELAGLRLSCGTGNQFQLSEQLVESLWVRRPAGWVALILGHR